MVFLGLCFRNGLCLGPSVEEAKKESMYSGSVRSKRSPGTGSISSLDQRLSGEQQPYLTLLVSCSPLE